MKERHKKHEPDVMDMDQTHDDFQEVKNKRRPNPKTTKENKETEDEADEETNDEKTKKGMKLHQRRKWIT